MKISKLRRFEPRRVDVLVSWRLVKCRPFHKIAGPANGLWASHKMSLHALKLLDDFWGWQQRLLTVAGLFSAFVLLGAFTFGVILLTRAGGDVASIWPSNALILALIIRGHASFYLWGAVAIWGANVASGNPLALSTALMGANIVEVGFAHAMLIVFGLRDPDLRRLRSVVGFLVISAGVAPVVGALLGARAVSAASGAPFGDVVLSWYGADALGMAVFAPLFLSFKDWKSDLGLSRGHAMALVAVLLGTVLTATATFAARDLLFICTPLILLSTMNWGIAGATLALCCVATAGAIATFGQTSLIFPTVEPAARLQIFLAVHVCMCLPIAAILAQRRELQNELSTARALAEARSAEKEIQVDQLTRRLWDVESEERARVSRELHDIAGQTLATMVMQVRAIELEASALLVPRLVELRQNLSAHGQDLDRLSRELRPAALDKLGLVRALDALIGNWAAVHHIETDFVTSGDKTNDIPLRVQTILYRVVQEALTNVARHAEGATKVTVSLATAEGYLRVAVADNGCGAMPNKIAKHGGGLQGMRERLAMVDGDLDIETHVLEVDNMSGTTVFARIPLEINHATAH